MFSATVYLDTHHHAGVIDPRIFGGFLEHLGRCVYEGVYDPGSPHADKNGFRLDVIESLKKLNMPVMRYPGGNFVSAYDWKDGVGPKEKRPRRPDFAWWSIESNQFGTDEFMQWCKMLGTEPMMAVNLGTSEPKDASALLEYCNLNHGTYWSDQRKANGHAEPYNVKYWCLGNEMDGPWQAGHCTAMEYARKAWRASKLMKGLDSKIQTIICGSSGRGMTTYMEWDRTVLEECWDTADYISAHRYSTNGQNNTPWFLAEGVEIDRVLQDYAGLISYVRGLKKNKNMVYLSFDEWNVWYRHRSHDGGWKEAPHLLEEVYNLEDALVCAQYLSSFIRRADVVKMACIAQIVNVIAPIFTRKDGILVQSIYHPMELMSRNAKGLSLTPSVESPLYSAEGTDRTDVPSIDVSSSYNPESGDASFFIVNRKIDGDAKVT
ncbi:MAG TPA: alpha-L-arabinofuranosidase C-terminal domain-containing protein, partial [Tepidisphaeraceae bacterium]